MQTDATRASLIEIGTLTTTPVGSFVTLRVKRSDLPKSRVAHERDDAITHARGQALGHGLEIVDVVAAVYQSDGSWLVELQVKGGAE